MKVFSKLTFHAITIRLGQHSLPRHFVIHELTFIDITVCQFQFTLAMFLIFSELVEGMDARNMQHSTDMGWMIDASHNVKDPLEDLLQSVEAILISYAQALLVDRKALNAAQAEMDVVRCQEILQDAFRTDTRPLVAESRLQLGAALKPIDLYRNLKIREKLIGERGKISVATGL